MNIDPLVIFHGGSSSGTMARYLGHLANNEQEPEKPTD